MATYDDLEGVATTFTDLIDETTVLYDDANYTFDDVAIVYDGR